VPDRDSPSWRDEISGRQLARLKPLPRKFYERPSIDVARSVLGKILVLGECAGRIVEVEAYLGETDRAAHAWHGRTPRTEVLYGAPGRAYIYLIYGMYECLNLVAEPENSPGCVLVRALEPVAGLARMLERRGTVARPSQLCSGPGKLTRAMGITRELYGCDLARGPLRVCEPESHSGEIETSPRIGIRHCVDWPLRFFLRGNPCVSRPLLARR